MSVPRAMWGGSVHFPSRFGVTGTLFVLRVSHEGGVGLIKETV